MPLPRFVVGIDLGTTNCALAAVDTGAGEAAKPSVVLIPQVVAPGAVEARPLLPSFLYLPGAGEQPAGALKLPSELLEGDTGTSPSASRSSFRMPI